jgi:hypothetical protein
MRHFAAVAMLVVGIMLPVYAQRGGSHGGSGHSGSGFHGGFSGGSSGHAASGFRGGFSASAPSRFSGNSRYAGPVRPGVARGLPMGSQYNYGARRGYAGASRYRRPYRSPYRAGYPYGVAPWTGWVDPYLLDYPDDTGYDDSTTSQDYANDGYDSQPPDPQFPEKDQPPPSPPAYRPSYGQPNPSPAPESEAAVTLVFKDGRPPEQIHNYMLSRSTLSVLDKHHREIPVDQLDLAATEKVNRDAGVDFRLPSDSK